MIGRMTGKSMKNCEKKISTLILSLALVITAGVVLFNPVSAHALPRGEIEGIWQGVLRFSGTELRVAFTITKNRDNTLDATMDVPEQNATGVPVDDIVVDDGNVCLEITPIEGVFKGKLSEDGETIDGTWTQAGMTLALVQERNDEKLILERPQEPKEPFPYRVEDVVFKNTNASIMLAGTLTFPPSGGSFPRRTAPFRIRSSGPR